MTSFGKCFLCGRSVTKRGMTRHLRACRERSLATQDKKKRPVLLYHLIVEGKEDPIYWLHLEVPAKTTLDDLDQFLRAIWLECCGHLSRFVFSGNRVWDPHVDYEEEFQDLEQLRELLNLPPGTGDRMLAEIVGIPKVLPVDTPLQRVVNVGDKFTHEYDFGSTTYLALRVVDAYTGPPPEEGIRVLARNYAPRYPCVVCEEKATYWYCFSYPGEPYCAFHAREHKEWPDAFLPIVNSPRRGVCGYDGPAREELRFEKPYPGEE